MLCAMVADSAWSLLLHVCYVVMLAYAEDSLEAATLQQHAGVLT